MKKFTVLLMSGLGLEKKSSFSGQLELLGSCLEKRGLKAMINGPCTDPHSSSSLRKREISGGSLERSVHFDELIQKTGAEAAILLGYPDQFSFLHAESDSSIPLFLWSQFSKPPPIESLGRAVPVPLTEKTRGFLLDSGIQNVSPVIPHGVDLSVYHPLAREERQSIRARLGVEDRFVVGSVGANTPRKKFDRIIESFALFSKKREDALLLIKTDRVMSIDGTDLRRVAEKFGVASRTELSDDELTCPQMCNLYNAMDVYLNLSEWEGFCLPVIEAMACETSIVTHPIQGPGEIIPYDELLVPGSAVVKEGDTMLLWADPDETARTLLRAAADPTLLKRLATLGREEAEKRYDIRIIARMWEEVLRQVL